VYSLLFSSLLFSSLLPSSTISFFHFLFVIVSQNYTGNPFAVCPLAALSLSALSSNTHTQTHTHPHTHTHTHTSHNLFIMVIGDSDLCLPCNQIVLQHVCVRVLANVCLRVFFCLFTLSLIISRLQSGLPGLVNLLINLPKSLGVDGKLRVFMCACGDSG